jgi:UPF0042 nucleotide-binding protein
MSSPRPPPVGTTHVVVVTGLSGAGKSTAIAAFEDLGYHSIENLPPAVIEQAIQACEQLDIREIALGFGAGAGGLVESAAEALSRLATSPSRRLTVAFLDASDEVLLRRFSETRRPHPLLSGKRSTPRLAEIRDGIRLERERLAPLREMATVVVDTTDLRVHDLRRRILGTFAGDAAPALRMRTRILSFGFKYGLPGDADVVFDVRFLDNPYFVHDLRELTGEDDRVREHVLASEDARRFLQMVTDLAVFLLPRYEAEGKSYLTIAFGCTGGQHRSVTMARALERELAARGVTSLRVVHRDVHESAASSERTAGGGLERGG